MLYAGLRLSSFANSIGFYYYRPIVELIPIALRIQRGRPREVGHEEDRATVRRVVEKGRSAFLFLRTQLLKNFLSSRKSEKRRDELDLIGEVVAAAMEQGGPREVFLVPLAIFWTKGPRAENRFLNVDFDYPVDQKPPLGAGGWARGDAAVLLYDRFDVWSFAPDGSGGRRLTEGARDSVVHRVVRLDREQPGIDLAKPLYLSLAGEWSKRSGYARLRLPQRRPSPHLR